MGAVGVDAAWRFCYFNGDEWNECALDEAAGVAFEAVHLNVAVEDRYGDTVQMPVGSTWVGFSAR